MQQLMFFIGIFFLFAGLLNLIAVYFFYPFFLKFKQSLKKNNTTPVPEFQQEYNNFKICIIIPFYNELSILTEKFNSISEKFINATNSEIILINDGNQNLDSEKISQIINASNLKDKIKFFKISKHYGKTFALYFAAKQTDADYLLFTDSNSIFAIDYFNNLETLLESSAPDLIGGLLKYKIESPHEKNENKYWSIESKLKIAEQNAGLFCIGLFGSNIIIKRNLYLTYPYYTFCDFSLPLYYQNETGKKIKIQENLIVFENSLSDNYLELFRIKKRIIHRALAGLKKYLILTKKINNSLFEQVYFHKAGRWLTPYWLFFIFFGGLITTSILELSLLYSALFIIIFFFSCAYFFRLKPLYLITINAAAFCAIISFLTKPKLDRWIPSKK